MKIKRFKRYIFSISSVLFLIVILTSCGDFHSPSTDDQGSVTHDGTNMNLEFPVPRFLTDSSSVIDSLQAQATIDGGSPHTLDVDPNTNQISGTITEVSFGNHNSGNKLLRLHFERQSGSVYVFNTGNRVYRTNYIRHNSAYRS